MCIHCEKRPSAQLFDLHGRVRMQIFSVEHNIGNLVTICMQTRASMRTFSCEHIRVSQKVV